MSRYIEDYHIECISVPGDRTSMVELLCIRTIKIDYDLIRYQYLCRLHKLDILEFIGNIDTNGYVNVLHILCIPFSDITLILCLTNIIILTNSCHDFCGGMDSPEHNDNNIFTLY